MQRKALADKILILGVDGLDPSLTKKFINQGKLPNIKAFVDRGGQREDLVMLGGVPTITPPLWTTMATGSSPGTHGITCFWNQSHEDLDTIVYALDSRKCLNEQLWNVFAESGKKTLVWHWPGSSWPPTSESPNLHVVDGTQPAAIQAGVAAIDWEKMIVASTEFNEIIYRPRATSDNGAGCIITDLDGAVEEEKDSATAVLDGILTGGGAEKKVTNVMLTHEDGELALDKIPFDIVNSPIKEPVGWADTPIGAKEFTLVTSNGFINRPSLILKNAHGIYDKVAIYKSKKDISPLLTLEKDIATFSFVDDILVGDETHSANRHLKLLDIEPDGSKIRIWASMALDISHDGMWHPKSLYHTVVENAGYVPMTSAMGGKDIDVVERVGLDCWHYYSRWQSRALNYLVDHGGYEVIFSHIHNVDSCGHSYWYFGKERAEFGNDENRYQKAMEEIYLQTDEYLGSFLHLLDQGWTILIMSDHGLLTTDETHQPLIGDAFGCNVKMLQDMGYCALKTDEEGRELAEIDWSKTKAVAPRGGHIWLNLIGRNKTGIVPPEEQYELERNIISDLYSYRIDGKRVISLAMRNKDGALLGMSGPECGDIIYFLEEGFNRIHGDSLSTYQGYNDTSVSPILIAAGKGIKEGIKTERVIRQIDFAPTIAVLGGVRMPKHCEGAPVYQMLTEEF